MALPIAEPLRRTRRTALIGFVGGAAGLLLAALLAFSVGAYPVSPADLATWLAGSMGLPARDLDPSAALVIEEIRGPRVATAMMVGAALAAAGAAYQALFRNPLVSPDILGVSSGAALGAVLGIYFSMPVVGIEVLALAGGLAAVAVVYLVGARIRAHDPVLVMVLMGIVIGALLGSGVSLVKLLADPYNQLPAITFWLLGSLSAITRGDFLALLPAFVAGIAPLALLHWRMNVMTLGEEEARALGVDTRRVRLAVVAGATLMTAAAVSVSGIVGWVGLVVPHLARLVVGPSFGRLLATSALFGAAFLLVVDTLARTLGRTEIPLGVLTATIGAPIFVWLLAAGRRPWQ
jgi:iron complex transport system permease protein